MTPPIIHVFGNSDIAMDALPLQMLPRLKEAFPEVTFRTLDPNEEWDIPNPFVLIDTIVGIADIHVFHSLDEFSASPVLSVHDFDALFQLRYLAKLGKLKQVIIVGIPPHASEVVAEKKVVTILKELISG